ncbi:TPA: hypothetical protein N0F65_011418 [Lagenidium giganteum]|uniref:Sodium/calcium exchanger membrane region domain-containing protein n=1 Tax=Lagenidium giganteum TaxID=4803 RepID=A0AAV2Z9S9_9STRA|nr:TPA: hypothetical protein N0F65_011418 [Lagenidium giganteum]
MDAVMMDCAHLAANRTLGPLQIDYLYLHYCVLDEYVWLSVLLFVGWLGVLFYMLGSTADGYFSPTLATISEKLNVPYDFAGVTFLAFGNGAPDVFSSIAAYSSGVADTGVNELLGGAMFVSTVVVGAVALAANVRVDRGPFSRDLFALMFAVLLLVALARMHLGSTKHGVQVLAAAFLLSYAAYVSTVVLAQCMGRCRRSHTVGDANKQPQTKGGVLSAFWHALSPRASKPANHYVFITQQEAQAPGRDTYEMKTPIAKADSFGSDVFDDHFHADSFTSPLISDEDRDDGFMDVESVDVAFSSGAGIIDAAYWNHLRWRWRLKRRVGRILCSDSPLLPKIISIPEALLVLVRDYTVPLLETDTWSRTAVSVSVITIPLFLLAMSGFWNEDVGERKVPAWVVAGTCGVSGAVVVSFTTHRSRPPTSLAYTLVLLAMAFVSCVCWIYAIASELMAVLIAIGTITHANNSILGLTVLSWGNSVGDLMTNVSVARAGFPEMAIAGCFGGPVFNILLGLGLPMGYAFLHGEPVDLSVDVHAKLSAAFLVLTLASSYAVFWWHKFRCPSWYGRLLLVYYCTYAIINLAIALGVL